MKATLSLAVKLNFIVPGDVFTNLILPRPLAGTLPVSTVKTEARVLSTLLPVTNQVYGILGFNEPDKVNRLVGFSPFTVWAGRICRGVSILFIKKYPEAFG